MELQVRIAYETAEMLEELKEYYQKQSGINFTKGAVLTKAILDTYDDWKEIDWSKTLSLPIKITKEYNLKSGSLRPKFQLEDNLDSKIDELRTIIKQSVDARSVTIGAAIKFVLRQVIYEIQSDDSNSIENVVNNTLDDYLSKELSDQMKEILKEYTDELLTKFELNDLL
ncbi:MAG: hypothetical protein MR028_05305 [Ligilactobacillus agilis]|uniref:hypothetical protein n=1 Tax=Ligilactobacillus agilis TaxID=1601 RepID=UPI00242B6465|nr:hypothetical protein [Ligilactobacillus agilis]MCI5761831.1 hypothetical protein [Ligilactobacillus agilis]